MVSCSEGPSDAPDGPVQTLVHGATQPGSKVEVSLAGLTPPLVPPLPGIGGVAVQEWAPGTTTGPVGLPAALLDGFNRYATVAGRSSRSAYWWWQFCLICLAVGWMTSASHSDAAFVVLSLVGLVIILPSLALTVRRLHDMNASGWWVLLMAVLGFVPLGGIVTLIWMCQPGTKGPNRFGPGYHDAAIQPPAKPTPTHVG